jgi:hypothetical protein
MPARPIVTGDKVYLIARHDTAVNIAYRQPRVLVVARHGPMVTVRVLLEGDALGDVHEVHEDNLVRNLPKPRSARRSAPGAPLDLAPGEEEVPLW